VPTEKTVTARDVSHAADHAAWAGNFAGALVVGGGTVALTFILSGNPLRKEVYVALLVLYGLLLLGCILWEIWAETALGHKRRAPETFNRLAPGAVFVLIGIFTGATNVKRAWPIAPYTSHWWTFVAIALMAALLGGQHRTFNRHILNECDALRAS
jgi:glucose dehydrogenase